MSTEILEKPEAATEVSEEVAAAAGATRRDATVMELATIIAMSRDFPDCRTPEKAAVRILAGREMGVGPIASIIGIRVQAGRVSMDATLMAGCIKRSERYDYRVLEHTNEVCRLAFMENGQSSGESSFTWEDAKKASLHTKDTWKNYPRNMLFARALSNGARWYCAGIFGGSIYNHEELGIAVDDEGRAIEDTAGTGSGELCNREQRQQIVKLVELLGETLKAYTEKLGVKLLDELSQFEAEREIKRLTKRLEKTGKPTEASAPTPSASAGEPDLTAAQSTMAEAIDESRQPSTDEQRQRIIALAQQIQPEEEACAEMIRGWLVKRNCKKLAELNHLQAAALIESIESRLAQPPFEPNPAKTGS